MTICAVSKLLAEVGIQTLVWNVYTGVKVMNRTTAPQSSLIVLAAKASVVAALVAGLLAGRVPDALIIVGIIVVASAVAWHRTQLVPARVRSQHRFTVVSRCGDEFLTIDSSGVRRVTRHVVVDGPAS